MGRQHSIDGLNDPSIDPNMPIYDLQMQEGPQIKARLLMRELQLEEETQGYKPKVIKGFGFKHTKKALEGKEGGQATQPDPLQMASLSAGTLNGPKPISSDVYNYQSEMMVQDYLSKKGQLKNSIRQKDNLVSFNSSSPRFEAQKQIQIITGQDPESGNLYIIKDDKTNLGPGYYQNQEEIKSIKKEFEAIMSKNRQAKIRNTAVSPQGGFGSSTTREVGSTH